MTRRLMLAGLLALGTLGLAAAPSQAVLPGVGVISKKNMEWVGNVEQAVGSDIEFMEMKQPDGSLKRYALTGSMGSGLIISDITNPDLPLITGVYVNPGVNWQGDVQVNPRRKIAVLATESPGNNVTPCVGDGIVLIDVKNPALPTLLSAVCSVSAHNATIINDDYIYTADRHIVQYTDPTAPVDKGAYSTFCGIHDITVDPNKPNRAHFACPGNTYQIWDTTNAAAPVRISNTTVQGMATAHQADPSPDSALVAISNEQGGGITCFSAPCGGLHIYDISGKYVAGASEKSPKKLGVYFVPFFNPTNGANLQWGNNTAHNFTFQAERYLLSVGWYTVGSWVTDLTSATVATGGLYSEYKGTSFGGPTTWGNTTGNILLEGDEVWSTKWTRFDDPRYDTYLFNNGMTRGLDVLRYTGPMPKKIARLQVDAAAAGGRVSGKLDRFAVWTYNGNENKPLAGAPKTVTIAVGAQSVTASTAADGTFSAQLSLPAGTHSAVVTWAGDDAYQAASVTQAVTV